MRRAFVCFFSSLSACGILQVQVPHQETEMALSVGSQPTGGCPESGLIFEQVLEVDALKERQFGFRACITAINDVRITTRDMVMSKAAECSGPRGTVSDVSLELSYSGEQGEPLTLSVPCDGVIDVASDESVSNGLGACLSKVAAKKEELRVALNAQDRRLLFRAKGQCSPEACFSAKARVAIEMTGINATNCF
jgi:hypothetical protein